MKTFLGLAIQGYAALHLTKKIIALWFEPGKMSYYLAEFAIFIVVYELLILPLFRYAYYQKISVTLDIDKEKFKKLVEEVEKDHSDNKNDDL